MLTPKPPYRPWAVLQVHMATSTVSIPHHHSGNLEEGDGKSNERKKDTVRSRENGGSMEGLGAGGRQEAQGELKAAIPKFLLVASCVSSPYPRALPVRLCWQWLQGKR